MKILTNDPIGEDLFDGQTHERIAEKIAEQIASPMRFYSPVEGRSLNNVSVIGIEGPWGSGKSNVIRMVEQLVAKKYNTKAIFFLYDLWGHQEDLTRKTILEELIANLVDRKFLKRKWLDDVKQLTSVIQEKKRTETPSINLAVVFIAVSVGIMPFIRFYQDAITDLFWRRMFLLLPVFLSLGALAFSIVGDLLNGHQLKGAICRSLWVFRKRKYDTSIVDFLHEVNPSVAEFANFLRKAVCALGKTQRLILVFDNMDRLPKKRIREFWAAAHILFADCSRKQREKISVIVPFDRQRVRAAFSDEDYGASAIPDDFINKTFDVVYRLAPPILKDWKCFFCEKFNNVFGESPALRPQCDDVKFVFDRMANASDMTPRGIIAFFNGLATTYSIVDDSIPLRTLALFELGWKRYELEETVLPETAIREGRFLKGDAYLRAEYLEDEGSIESMAAVVFQLPRKRAGEVLKFNVLKKALQEGDAEILLSMSGQEGFDRLFRSVLPDLKNAHMAPGAMKGLVVDAAQQYWDWLYQYKGDEIIAQGFMEEVLPECHKMMLQHITKWAEYSAKLLRSEKKELKIKTMFAHLVLVDDVLKEVNRGLRGAMPVKEVSAESYLEMLLTATDKYEIFCWNCADANLDAAAAKLACDSVSDVYGLIYLDETRRKHLIKTRQALAGIEDLGVEDELIDVFAMRLLECLEALGEGRVTTALAIDQIRKYVAGEHDSEKDRARAVACALRWKLDLEEFEWASKYLKQEGSSEAIELLKSVLLRYLQVEDLLLAAAKYPWATLLTQVARVAFEICGEKFGADYAEDILRNMGKIIEATNLDPVSFENKMTVVDGIQYGDHSRYYSNKTLAQLKKSRGEIWERAQREIRSNLDSFSKEKWIKKLSSENRLWTPGAAINIEYTWSDVALDAVSEILHGVAAGEYDDQMPSAEVWNMLVDDLARKRVGVGSTFKKVKDYIVRQSNELSASAFVFLMPWIFRYATFGKDADELRKIVSSEVRDHSECWPILVTHVSKVRKMLRKADDEDRESFMQFVRHVVDDGDVAMKIFLE